MQQPPNTATTNTSGFLEVLATFYEAFAEHDAGRRGELLARCLTPDAAIWGHSRVFAGYAAISEKIAEFHSNWSDCRLVLASGLFAFDYSCVPALRLSARMVLCWRVASR